MHGIPLQDLSDHDLLVLAVTKINEVAEKVCIHDSKIRVIEMNCNSRTAMYEAKEKALDLEKAEEDKSEHKTMWGIGIGLSLLLGVGAWLKDFLVK